MKHLDLFSGIGGFALAAQWCWGKDHDPVAFCEIEPFAQKVLKKHWPDVPIKSDIRKLNGKEYSGINLLTGGFPCQPFSVAGKRRGKEDDRDLWPEMCRVITESRPDWVIGENVAGFVKMELDRALSDLGSIGYTCQPLVIPACAIGAPHRRDRVWIVANTNGSRRKKQHDTSKSSGKGLSTRDTSIEEDVTDSNRNGWQQSVMACFSSPGLHGAFGDFRRAPEPTIHRMDDGVSKRLDRNRIKALGNAIVPQVAYEIMAAIKAVDLEVRK